MALYALMKLNIRQIGPFAYEVRNRSGCKLGIVRLVDTVRKVPRLDASGRVRFPSADRVWVIDGEPTREFGNRDAAIRWLARRG